MGSSASVAKDIVQVFVRYCKEKNYQIQSDEDANNDWRLEISNLAERTLVLIYHTGSIVLGGKKNKLKEEFENLKDQFLNNPQHFFDEDPIIVRSCSARYDVLLPEYRQTIKENLDAKEAKLEVIEKPDSNTDYRAKLISGRKTLTITQYNNGTLFLQGKEDNLFDGICDLIEKSANPTEKEVAARFICTDEKSLEIFSAKFTPKIIEISEENVKNNLESVYDYLEPYDQKWFVASECLCLSDIPLPEFSPLVMPASKAFEGFAKKLLTDIGLFPVDHFKSKKGNFSPLYDGTNAIRKSICAIEKYCDSMLKRVGLSLDTNRNFLMHSDESKITKISSPEDAKRKVNDILRDTKEIFNYFNDQFNII